MNTVKCVPMSTEIQIIQNNKVLQIMFLKQSTFLNFWLHTFKSVMSITHRLYHDYATLKHYRHA